MAADLLIADKAFDANERVITLLADKHYGCDFIDLRNVKISESMGRRRFGSHWMMVAPIETTLELWASTLRDVKRRTHGLFAQGARR